MDIASLIRSADRKATALAAISFAMLLVKAVALNRIEAPYAAMFDLGVLADAVLTSVVASYVFYLIVVHLKESQDKSVLAPYVNRHTLRVVTLCQSQLNDIARTSGVNLDFDTLEVTQLADAFGRIHPYSDAPLVLAPDNRNANWYQYFDFHRGRSKESIQRVLAQLPFLDATHVGLLAEVDDCSHFNFIPLFLHVPTRNTDMASFASMFFSYCKSCQDLSKYMSKSGMRSAA